MASKTETEIERDKEAVAKMIGAKSAMEAALRQHDRLRLTVEQLLRGLAEVKKVSGPDVMIRTYCGPGREVETMTVHKMIEYLDAKAREVL